MHRENVAVLYSKIEHVHFIQTDAGMSKYILRTDIAFKEQRAQCFCYIRLRVEFISHEKDSQ